MKKKRLPRLWCALQGLMPIEACLAAQRGELAWPPEPSPRARKRVIDQGRLAPAERVQP